MEYIAIIKVILEVIAKCRENRGQSAVVEEVRKGSTIGSRWAVRKAIRAKGGNLADIRTAMQELRDFDPQEAQYAVEEAERHAATIGMALVE